MYEINPFRYRGYYYDVETGWYYLQSRYYNPEWGRFLNADGQLNNDILGSNMFSYCSNNPVMRVDSGGYGWWVPVCALFGGAVGAVSKITSNLFTGQNWNDGVLGAIAGGATYGAVLASSGSICAASFASSAAESFVNEVTSYIPDINGSVQKELNTKNVSFSIANFIKDTALNGAINFVTGKVASMMYPTNNGWFTPQKFTSCLFGKYAIKSEVQTIAQSAGITFYNIARHYIHKALDFFVDLFDTQPENQEAVVVVYP